MSDIFSYGWGSVGICLQILVEGKKVKVQMQQCVKASHRIWYITQCYLPPGSGEFPRPLPPAEADTRFSDHDGGTPS